MGENVWFEPSWIQRVVFTRHQCSVQRGEFLVASRVVRTGAISFLSSWSGYLFYFVFLCVLSLRSILAKPVRFSSGQRL